MKKFSDLLDSQMQTIHRILIAVAVVMIGFSTTMWVSSCTIEPHVTDDPTVVQAGFQEADNLITNAQIEIARLEAKAATTGTPLSPDEAATLARTKAWVNKTAVLLQDAEARAAAAGRAPDTGDLVTGVFSAIGGPIGIFGGLISGAVAESIRTRKKRKSFEALVGALDAVKKKNPLFAEQLDAVGPELRNEMGTTAKTTIDKMRAA